MTFKSILFLAPITALAALVDSSFEVSCISLAGTLKIENVTPWFSHYVAAGASIDLSRDQDQTCLDEGQSPSEIVMPQDACRLALKIDTSKSSETNVEVWLPREWTGRLLGTGTGGFSGCVQHQTLRRGVESGFAAVSSNAGHNGTSTAPFLNNAEVVKDWAGRSIHLSTVVAKQIIENFYGRAYTKAYYSSCSNGGRQGIKEATEYPEDYDGIIAGAPLVSIYNYLAGLGKIYLTTGRSEESPSFLPFSKWELVHQHVFKRCDGLDGIEDGLLENPAACYIQPSVLRSSACESEQDCNISSYLTEAQATTVKTLFSPLLDPNGTDYFPAFTPGAEIGAFPVLFSGANAVAVQGALDAFRFIVYNDPLFDFDTATLDDFTFAIKQNAGDADTSSGDLSLFQRKGGKLIQFHGAIDSALTEGISSRYYHSVARTMNLAPEELDSFYRYFRISGMDHCQLGPGAWNIGQTTLFPGQYDANATVDYDVLKALVAWVEEGMPPETVTGRKFVDNEVAGKVLLEKKHCRFPMANRYVEGDPTVAESWNCV